MKNLIALAVLSILTFACAEKEEIIPNTQEHTVTNVVSRTNDDCSNFYMFEVSSTDAQNAINGNGYDFSSQESAYNNVFGGGTIGGGEEGLVIICYHGSSTTCFGIYGVSSCDDSRLSCDSGCTCHEI